MLLTTCTKGHRMLNEENENLKKLLLITTGGTIASVDMGEGLTPGIQGSNLLEYVPSLTTNYEIDIKNIMNIDSTDLVISDWKTIRNTVVDNYDNYDAFVITHGTDSLSYTAAALSYLIQNLTKTVVITGSQYSIGYEITDGTKNLYDACLFAAKNTIPGVYVVFNSKVILGTRAKKVRSMDYAGFESINYPTIANIYADTIRYNILCTKSEGEFKVYDKLSDDICIIKIFPGITEEYFDRATANNRAIIVECFGVAGIPNRLLDSIARALDKDKIIVVCTQALFDGSNLDTYTAGHFLHSNKGVLESWDMTIEATYAKLSYLLGNFETVEDITREFYKPINFDINIENTIG